VQDVAMPLFFGWLVLLFFGAYSNKNSQPLLSIAVSLFGILYVVIPLGLTFDLLYLPTEIKVDGRWWIAYVVIITALTNMGGYFIGRRWGRHSLAPSISPKKTVEGAIAGLIWALIGAAIWASFAPAPLSFIEFVFLAILVSIVAQVGDLAESLLKRDAQVKDSGHIPGLGGVLDEVDSYLFTLPLVYIYLRAFYGLGA
jgi:phosphatidate cytidylyltransferase